METERRYLQECNYRFVKGENGARDKVYFTPIIMGVRSNNTGFNEEIDPTAFDEADMSDIRALFNHDPNLVMGRTKNGTLQWERVDNRIEAVATLPDSFPAYQRELMSDGYVTGASFGFFTRHSDSEYYTLKREGDGLLGRLKRATKVFDMSVVAFPFYDQTEGSVQMTKQMRSLIEATEMPTISHQEIAPQEQENPKEVDPQIRLIQLDYNLLTAENK